MNVGRGEPISYNGHIYMHFCLQEINNPSYVAPILQKNFLKKHRYFKLNIYLVSDTRVYIQSLPFSQITVKVVFGVCVYVSFLKSPGQVNYTRKHPKICVYMQQNKMNDFVYSNQASIQEKEKKRTCKQR